MAKSNKNLSGLVNQLSRARTNAQGIGKLLSPTDLVNPTAASTTEKTSKPGNSGDTKTLSITAKSTPTSIKFGAPSSTRTTASQSGSEWTNLLKQTASGGIASALGGGLSSIGGLGSLISGIVSLFEGGSKKAPAPLVKFNLPASQQQTVYVSSKGSAVYQGSVTEQESASKPGGGIYGTSGQANSAHTSEQSSQYQNTQIVQAVKNALLNSSSLNDVIVEI